MLSKIIIIKSRLLSLFFFFNFCWYCGKLQIGIGVCLKCWSEISFLCSNYCALCSNIYAYEICAICNLKAFALFQYNLVISSLILSMKYNYKFYLSDFFINHIKGEGLYNCKILYVPHFRFKQVKIGVNSSLLLANSFQKRFGGEVLHNILIKTNSFRQKDSKSYEERYNQPFYNYHIRNGDRLKNQKIILIDDVITTGSTISRCASLIRKQDPSSLKVIIIAKV